jgi:hypothetical protein
MQWMERILFVFLLKGSLHLKATSTSFVSAPDAADHSPDLNLTRVFQIKTISGDTKRS